MRAAAIAMLMLLVAACERPAGPHASATSPPTASPVAATATPVATVASPPATPSTSPPASPRPIQPVDFSCRLPFVEQVDLTRTQAGFIAFPGGAFTADPEAPPNAADYDSTVARWLPVGREAVAPDGLSYAFVTGGSPSTSPGPPRLHVVDAATGVETAFDLSLPGTLPYGVIGFTSEGVYVGSSWEGSAFGYWRVDPRSGAAVSLGTKQPEFDDGTGHVWRLVVDARDTRPALSALSGEPLPDEVVQHDLKTGADVVWFYRPGYNVAIAGRFQSTGILVWTEPPISASGGGGHEYWIAGEPGRPKLVARIEYGGRTASDTHGIWMGGADSLYLFTPDGAVRRVANVAGEPAGGCL